MIISIDGLIGCGKSTLLRYLESGPGLLVHPEPVHDWQPYLDAMYAREPGSAFRLQAKVWMDRCHRPPPSGQVFVERSPFFQWECFVKGNRRAVLAETDKIDDLEFRILDQMYRSTEAQWRPDVYIYLRCSPEVCHRRIQERSGGGEDISLEYLRMLHERHEAAFRAARAAALPIVAIDSETTEVALIAQKVLDTVASMSDLVDQGGRVIPVPERLLYTSYQLLDWCAHWNCEDEDMNPPASLCRVVSDELEQLWRAP